MPLDISGDILAPPSKVLFVSSSKSYDILPRCSKLLFVEIQSSKG